MLKRLSIILSIVFLVGILPSYASTDKSVVAVMYHDVTQNPFLYSQYRISAKAFEEDVVEFIENGYTFLKASELTEEYISQRPEQKFVALTFDDGYESFYTEIFPVLKKYNVVATFYILTSQIDRKDHLSTYQLRELAKSDLVELGAHSHLVHRLGREGIQRLYDGETSRWEASDDYKKSVEILERIIGKEVTSISYPNGIYNEDVDWIIKNNLGINVTIGTSFGKITSFDKPLNRINRDINQSSEDFLALIERAR